jgi:drug/metabolite transporter (DMT)-like permease
MKYILILIVVMMISSGQILFKMIAKNMPGSFALSEWIAFVFAPLTISVFALYGIATFLWIYVLKLYPLSTAYPIMALGFVIVPFASFIFFNEQITLRLIMGSLLIICGVLIIAIEHN